MWNMNHRFLNLKISSILKIKILQMNYSKPKRVNKSINRIFNLVRHLILRKTSKSIACMQNHIKIIILHQNWIPNSQGKIVFRLFTTHNKKSLIVICLSLKENLLR